MLMADVTSIIFYIPCKAKEKCPKMYNHQVAGSLHISLVPRRPRNHGPPRRPPLLLLSLFEHIRCAPLASTKDSLRRDRSVRASPLRLTSITDQQEPRLTRDDLASALNTINLFSADNRRAVDTGRVTRERRHAAATRFDIGRRVEAFVHAHLVQAGYGARRVSTRACGAFGETASAKVGGHDGAGWAVLVGRYTGEVADFVVGLAYE
jgi:hypothetical protein